jgi:2-polyprenyl-3-methyl-5-hydroxy-6-metoxy-1,4-benzoquinol methylase
MLRIALLPAPNVVYNFYVRRNIWQVLTILKKYGKMLYKELIMSKSIDKDVLAGYNEGIERNRLRNDLGLIEFERTKEILLENITQKSTIYDIGGGYGEYSWWLASLGHNVYLYDISEKNIEMAEEMKNKYPECVLEVMEVADAREIERPDSSADVVLLFGPLYHIVEYEERQTALKECYRLLKPNGLLFTAAITRYATILWAITTYGIKHELLCEKEFIEMVEREIKDGQHIRNENSKYKGMGCSFFHLPDELEDELSQAGFKDIDIRGIIGPAWLTPNIDDRWKNLEERKAILRIVRLLEKEKPIMGLSTHILSISKK